MPTRKKKQPTSNAPKFEYVPMTPAELDASRKRLEEQVRKQKEIEATTDYRRLNPTLKDTSKPLPDGVISLGAAIASAMPEIEAMVEKNIEQLKKNLAKLQLELKKTGTSRKCVEHPSELEYVNIDATLAKTYRDSKFSPVYEECPLCKHQRLVNERFKTWLRKGIPGKVVHATFDNYETDIEPKKKALEKAKRQAERGRGFFLAVGNCGNGKSHLASAIVKFVGDGLFVTHCSLGDELRMTYETGGKTKLIAKYQKTPCLVIDEVDIDVKGDDIKVLLYMILAYRFENDLLTVLTSNHDLATLLKILGPRLEDRMAQNYLVATFTWESYRKQHRET